MTQNFNEWLKENPNKSYVDTHEFGLASFEAGQQSQQARIDELEKRIGDSIEFLGCVNHSLLYEKIDYVLEILRGEK